MEVTAGNARAADPSSRFLIIMDIVSPARRSQIMGRIRGKNTVPELSVRRTAHALGYRFRLHARQLPGSPDLIFPGRRIALFVHGCYWHRHENCRSAYSPKSNIEFWNKKFQNNVTRDERVRGELERMGWKVCIIWECQTKDPDDLGRKLRECLGA